MFNVEGDTRDPLLRENRLDDQVHMCQHTEGRCRNRPRARSKEGQSTHYWLLMHSLLVQDIHGNLIQSKRDSLMASQSAKSGAKADPKNPGISTPGQY